MPNWTPPPAGPARQAGRIFSSPVSPTIRTATEADQPTIRRLIKEAGINRMRLHWSNFLVAEEDGTIVGIGQVKAHGDGSRELASIAVIPTRQGQGVGSALIKTLLVHEHGVVYLTCRRQLQGYYERFGFRRLDPAEFPPYFRRLIPVINVVGRLFRVKILVMQRDAPLSSRSGPPAVT